MKKRTFFLAFLVTVSVVFSLAWETAAGADNDILTEESSQDDLLVSADEYPHEGGDALNELMRSITRTRTFNQVLYGLEGNYEVVEEVSGKLEEDGEIVRIRLIALRHEDGVYDRGLVLEVIPAEENSFIIPLPGDVRGFQSSMALKNFISLGKSEILLTVYSGRRGERFLIIAVASGRGEIILDTHTMRIPNVTGRFLNNYRAEIIVPETSERAMIDLSSRRAEYNRRRVYSEGGTFLRGGIVVQVDNISLFEPVDVTRDGIFEIRKIMDMSGAGRADRIAYIEATLKYTHGHWNVIDSWIAPAEDLSKMPLPRMVY